MFMFCSLSMILISNWHLCQKWQVSEVRSGSMLSPWNEEDTGCLTLRTLLTTSSSGWCSSPLITTECPRGWHFQKLFSNAPPPPGWPRLIPHETGTGDPCSLNLLPVLHALSKGRACLNAASLLVTGCLWQVAKQRCCDDDTGRRNAQTKLKNNRIRMRFRGRVRYNSSNNALQQQQWETSPTFDNCTDFLGVARPVSWRDRNTAMTDTHESGRTISTFRSSCNTNHEKKAAQNGDSVKQGGFALVIWTTNPQIHVQSCFRNFENSKCEICQPNQSHRALGVWFMTISCWSQKDRHTQARHPERHEDTTTKEVHRNTFDNLVNTTTSKNTIVWEQNRLFSPSKWLKKPGTSTPEISSGPFFLLCLFWINTGSTRSSAQGNCSAKSLAALQWR